MTRFVAFGDSITWGEDGRDSSISPQGAGIIRPAVRFPTPQTYPGALEIQLQTRYFGQSISVANAGKSAESAGDSATVSRFSAATSSSEVVLLMEGTNDLADRDSFDIPPAIANLRTMIRIAKSAGRRVFLATVPPMVPGRPRALAWSLVPTLNDQIRSLAASESVTLVDVYAALSPAADGYIGFDGEHPSADGYAKIADTFFAAIKSALEAPAASTSSRTLALPSPRR
jgi:lysophospholipase L1-like esterase